MNIGIIMSLVIAVCIVIIFNVISKLIVKQKESGYSVTRRMAQLKDFSQEKVIKNRLESYIAGNMKYEKKKKLNNLLVQSGLKLSTADLYLMSFFTAFGSAIVVGVLLNNHIVALAMLLVGGMLPTQVVRFIRNKRVIKLDSQIASFIRMTVKRYYVTGKLANSIQMTLSDFNGQEPITSEIKKTLSDIEVGASPIEALEEMEKRTQNEYLGLFVSNLQASANIGTEEMKQKLLDGVVAKFDEDIKLASKLKKEISQPVMEGFLMMLIVPATFIMQASSDETFIPFMRDDPMGRVAMAIAVLLMAASAWVIINKVGAPLEKDDE